MVDWRLVTTCRSSSRTGTATSPQRRRNVFRAYFSIADRVPVMLDFAATQGMRRVGLIASDTVFGQMMADTLVRYGTERHGMEFLRFDFPQDDTDNFTEQLKGIQQFEPDLFINGGVVRTNYLIIEQQRAGHPAGHPDDGDLRFPAAVGGLLAPLGAGRRRHYVAGDALPTVVAGSHRRRAYWFIDRYSTRYGSFPPDTALTHFTDVTVIARAVAASSGSRADVLDALERMSFDTWRGPIRYERGAEHWHHAAPELVLLQYQRLGQTSMRSAIIFPRTEATAPYRAPGGGGV
ncbi:ABC transporter substrate-binding protein [Salinispora arenicola]|uniref:ABC transporter substrate-binding protein n=1 Tax=Salinispora arenicola TaxID=168697 RepID=UPI0016A752F4|nr:ABC transporter substrate-binding protein [Salinispora arenicola]NIL65042.1 ABC transporter substrate-binding protein [Salinispora arenicola]